MKSPKKELSYTFWKNSPTGKVSGYLYCPEMTKRKIFEVKEFLTFSGSRYELLMKLDGSKQFRTVGIYTLEKDAIRGGDRIVKEVRNAIRKSW